MKVWKCIENGNVVLMFMWISPLLSSETVLLVAFARCNQ